MVRPPQKADDATKDALLISDSRASADSAMLQSFKKTVSLKRTMQDRVEIVRLFELVAAYVRKNNLQPDYPNSDPTYKTLKAV